MSPILRGGAERGLHCLLLDEVNQAKQQALPRPRRPVGHDRRRDAARMRHPSAAGDLDRRLGRRHRPLVRSGLGARPAPRRVVGRRRRARDHHAGSRARLRGVLGDYRLQVRSRDVRLREEGSWVRLRDRGLVSTGATSNVALLVLILINALANGSAIALAREATCKRREAAIRASATRSTRAQVRSTSAPRARGRHAVPATHWSPAHPEAAVIDAEIISEQRLFA